MTAATWPPEQTLQNQLLVLSADRPGVETGKVADLPRHLQPGDLLVVNDAATFPGSLEGRFEDGSAVELRLILELEPERWRAALLGAGSWRDRTEERPDPRFARAGERIALEGGIWARIAQVLGPRLAVLTIELPEERFWEWLYRFGRPIQYSYLRGSLALWSVQTAFASRPWAAEMPSAGHALRWELLLELRRRGVGLAWLTHATGISSTGDPRLDRRLPLAERSLIPEETVGAIARARRVYAVGTSVVRALEGRRLRHGRLVAGEECTGLRLGRSYRPRVVDGILTGMHELGESHFRLLESFVPRERLVQAQRIAEARGFLSHEFGDSCLIQARRLERARPREP